MKTVKSILLLSTLVLMACACLPVKDPAPSPASMGQKRILIRSEGQIYAGVAGVTGTTTDISIQTYNTGTYEIRGLGECGSWWGTGFDRAGWTALNLSALPMAPVCLFNIHMRVNELDAPAIGSLLVRRFDDPNVMPLRISVNDQVREGVNWIQLAKEGAPQMMYIPEGREVVISPTGKSGKIFIKGCGLNESEVFDQPIEKRISLYSLYKAHKGAIDETCVFDFLVNNDDKLKEGASLLVSVYNPYGSFLDAPVTTLGAFRDRCFEFQDPAAIALSVNGKTSKRWNSRKRCVDRTERYEIEGITSNLRIFYGVFVEASQQWEVVR